MLDWSVRSLLEDLKSGRIGRRQFIATLTRVGIPVGVVASMLASCGSEGDSSGADTPATDAPFEPKQRGGGGQLKLLYWQAPSILNPHMTRGTKDVDASSLFYEQLLYIDVDANFVMCRDGRLIEVQCTAEGASFSRSDLDRLSDLAFYGIKKLLQLQQ